MKKLFVLVALFITVYATSAQAQQGGDTTGMFARMKESMKPQLMEKAKLTSDQADKVVEINYNSWQQRRGLRDLSQDDRKKKMDELQTDMNNKYKAIPLTDDQAKAVNDFFADRRKNMQQRNGGGNGNGQ